MNDLYLYDLGLPEKLVVGVKRIITNIMFRSIMLQYMRAITDYHNQMCGWKTFIIMAYHHRYIHIFCRMIMKSLRNKSKGIATGSEKQAAVEQSTSTYKNKELKGAYSTPLQPKTKYAMLCIHCDNVEIFDFPYWSCALGQCCSNHDFAVLEAESEKVILIRESTSMSTIITHHATFIWRRIFLLDQRNAQNSPPSVLVIPLLKKARSGHTHTCKRRRNKLVNLWNITTSPSFSSTSTTTTTSSFYPKSTKMINKSRH